MGAMIELSSIRTQTISGSLTDGIQNKTTTTGSGNSDAKITAPGVEEALESIKLSHSAKVATGVTTASFGTSTDTDTYTILTVPDDKLDSYVGSSNGTVIVNLTTSTFNVSSTWSNGGAKTSPTSKSDSQATYKLRWYGDLAIYYDYLLHAAPSFDGSLSMLTLDLDFGTVFLGDVADMDFSIYNLAPVTGSPIDRVGLDLDTFDPFPVPFSFNLSTFYGLASGSNNIYTASMNTSTLGEFKATYHLYFSDEDVGASSSRFSYQDHPLMFQLTLNLSGRVEPIPVPEPGALSLLGVGLLGLPFARRRRS